MTAKIKGIKLNMSQIFLDTGKVIPVTVIGKIDDDITAEMENKPVQIIGISKGKGFAGGMKRWHFSGGPATGGQSTKPRAPGSIGSQTPGRVRKGKKMAGRLGGDRVTIKGLKIVRVMPDQKQLMVSGPVPGARNSKITIELK
ncbi:50S ribosomal protein L3 [candidate division WWE3 bacterium RIFOXYC2_FULL_42_13]|uniref:Large ribosomal subunit protein uL3 n=2 Tax=Katanobacteria TaxID=422282 RepID=A0A3D0ZQH6_UNCKA|nr:MAG: 50S ribosomal protein L3 [candidate division WWE3 bacterium RIFOXYA2_FULL_43_12]OGC65490.1 MAG: 50S ribosomal protein L3 [candidate division WWE3 bacterium RIFOXYA12_FULL_43_11]OGC71977.1 MAG: 50S ribosomal protein L3 [candidate division WWE3 bacterium RIFOXYB2_FULL_43_9]OGC73381.1 MAG: 50S ribosomal protein L3 [candidate division WWE3 bacterium RIFOXYC2_FULL_42_13]OGC75662.1 MAG: 50S ribosomal protein L3 [candidate division WWE3 bacterium RIFOXYD2_FULL_43_10]HBY10063.1 50S ribosomal p